MFNSDTIYRLHVGGRLGLLLIASMLAMSLTGSLPVDASQGRDTAAMSILLTKEVWSSAETFEATVSISGLISGRAYTLDWQIRSGNGTVVQDLMVRNGQQSFTATNPARQIKVEANHLDAAVSHLYRLMVNLSDHTGSTAVGQVNFSSFTNTLPVAYSDMIFFGDSLSDMGNSFNQWGTPDSPPYWNGRFSNGEVWSVGFGQFMGVSMNPGRGTGNGNNRAYGGAHSGSGSYLFVIPNVGKQVDDYLQNHQIDANELVVIWCGGNDFVHSDETDSQAVVDNIDGHISRLVNAGATEFLVLELPPLDTVPRINEENDAAGVAAMHERILDFNSKLHSMLNDTVNSSGLTIHRGLSWQMFDNVYNNPSYFGLTNITHPACDHDGYTCEDGDPIAPNAEQYIYFDKMHPTLTMHKLVDLYVREVMGIADIDGDGISDEFDNCTNTLPAIEVGSDGCDLPPPDEDADGVPDATDECAGTPAGAIVDERGCSSTQRDGDLDGVSDAIDECPTTPNAEPVDATGCGATERDGDGDGIVDAYDSCPSTPAGETVAGDGCAAMEVDRDGDGVMDDRDACLGTPAGEPVDSIGCGPSQLDDDGDGVSNIDDACPDTPAWEFPDETGCAPSQRDSDADGVVDSLDDCADTTGLVVDDSGCSDLQRDSDGDGRVDADDDCRLTAGSLRGCPVLSIEAVLVTAPPAPDGDAIVQLTLDCESNCTMALLYAPWKTDPVTINSGVHIVALQGYGSGVREVIFHISVNGTFAEHSMTLHWPEDAVPDDSDGVDSVTEQQNLTAIDSSKEAGFSAGFDISTAGLLSALLIANVIVLSIIIVRRRRRRNGRDDPHRDPGSLMDQTSLFR